MKLSRYKIFQIIFLKLLIIFDLLTFFAQKLHFQRFLNNFNYILRTIWFLARIRSKNSKISKIFNSYTHL